MLKAKLLQSDPIKLTPVVFPVKLEAAGHYYVHEHNI